MPEFATLAGLGVSMRLFLLALLIVVLAGPARTAYAAVEEFSTRGAVEFGATATGADTARWKGAVPTLPLPASLKPPNCPESIVIYIHGFQNTAGAATGNFNTAATRLADAGYTGTVYGFSWDSNPGVNKFDTARISADLNGKVLAQLLLDIKRSCPDTKVNVLTHSLGARVALKALKCGGCAHSVQMLAPAVNNEVLEAGQEFGDSTIGTRGGTVVVWHNDEDDVLEYTYRPEEGSKALGEEGSENGGGCLPANVFQLDTEPKLRKTGSEDNHSGYIHNLEVMKCVLKYLQK